MASDDRQVPEPMPEQTNSGSMPPARALRALRGAQWLVNAYAIFRRNTGAWMLVLLGLLAAMVVSSLLQVIGPLVFGLLYPVFTVGVALAAQDVDRGQPIVPAHFLSGFRSSTADLVAIGGLYLVGQLLILGLMMAIGGAGVAQGVAAGAAAGAPAGQATGPVAVTGAMAFAGLVGLALLVPLLLASWFAPLLVYFHGQKAFPALVSSLGAAVRNWRAFLVCFISLLLVMLLARLVVSVLALLPAIGPLLAMVFLGALIAVLAPVVLIAFYTSYVDVFSPADDVDAGSIDDQDVADDPQVTDDPQGTGQPPPPPASP